MYLTCNVTEVQVFLLNSKILFIFFIQIINVPTHLNKISNTDSALQILKPMRKRITVNSVIRILLNQFYLALLWNISTWFCSKYIATYFIVINVKWNYYSYLTPKHTNTCFCHEGLIRETEKCVSKEQQRLIKALVRDTERNKSFFICPKWWLLVSIACRYFDFEQITYYLCNTLQTDTRSEVQSFVYKHVSLRLS